MTNNHRRYWLVSLGIWQIHGSLQKLSLTCECHRTFVRHSALHHKNIGRVLQLQSWFVFTKLGGFAQNSGRIEGLVYRLAIYPFLNAIEPGDYEFFGSGPKMRLQYWEVLLTMVFLQANN